MLTTMSDAERRTLVTAQIAAALVANRNLTSETPESAIKQMAELAARIAKAVQEAAAKSLGEAAAVIGRSGPPREQACSARTVLKARL
jgi:hypothetical protein